jgi:hypothetical protein
MKRYSDLLGKRFGKLLIVSFHHSNNGRYWLCHCDCGNKSVVPTRSLNYGSTQSCGCGSIEQAKLNLIHSANSRRLPFPYIRKLKDLYSNIKDRCYNPNNKRYKNYGRRGITVCKKWLSNRHSFYKWATENNYQPGLSIDRINNDGNYKQSNCRFVDSFVQMNNTTRNHFVKFDGKVKTISQWARYLGVSSYALQHRFMRKWNTKRALTQPFRIIK